MAVLLLLLLLRLGRPHQDVEGEAALALDLVTLHEHAYTSSQARPGVALTKSLEEGTRAEFMDCQACGADSTFGPETFVVRRP